MAGITWRRGFPLNYLVILMFLVNLVVITSFPYPENSIVLRGKRSYGIQKGSKQHAGSSSSSNNAVKSSSPSRSAIFATENSTIVVAQIGGTATLPCVVKKFSSGVVSWIRKKESPTLLTVGLTTYSSDDRILVEHARHLQNWGLHIKRVQPSDAGLYECQVSTHPPTSIFMELRVTEASAEILGAPDLHLRAGSTLRLVCTFKHSTEPPSFVFWYHEQRMINYDPGVKVIGERPSSILLLQDADKTHNGNYTCSPSNAIPASINVHVLNSTEEENPAAMLHANGGGFRRPPKILELLLLLLINLMVHIVKR